MSRLELAAAIATVVSGLITFLDYFMTKEQIKALEDRHRPMLYELREKVPVIVETVISWPIAIFIFAVRSRFKALPLMLLSMVITFPLFN